MNGIVKMKEIFEVGYQLVNILKLVHCSNRTHNDLKPENIMITPPDSDNGQVKVHLIDFGFARKFVAEESKAHMKEGEEVEDF